jgi:hypothetical protein
MYTLTKRAMRCSWCCVECESLHEYSIVTTVAENQATIETMYLCAVCSVVYLLKPKRVARGRKKRFATTPRSENPVASAQPTAALASSTIPHDA